MDTVTVTIRIPRDTHERLAEAAQSNMHSINRELVERLNRSFGSEESRIEAKVDWIMDVIVDLQGSRMDPDLPVESMNEGQSSYWSEEAPQDQAEAVQQRMAQRPNPLPPLTEDRYFLGRSYKPRYSRTSDHAAIYRELVAVIEAAGVEGAKEKDLRRICLAHEDGPFFKYALRCDWIIKKDVEVPRRIGIFDG